MDISGVLVAVNAGLARARKEFNGKITNELEPEYEYGIITCAMRNFNEHFSQYYKKFCAFHKFESPERLFGLASVALVTVGLQLTYPSNRSQMTCIRLLFMLVMNSSCQLWVLTLQEQRMASLPSSTKKPLISRTRLS